MSANPTSQPNAWDVHEQLCLVVLKRDDIALHQRVNSMYTRFWDSSDDIKRILDELKECANTLFARRPLGKDLREQGRPAFDEKLDALIEYEQAQFAEFSKLYRNKLIFEATKRPTFVPREQFVPDPGKVFDLKAWQSIFNHTCINCEMMLGDNYYFARVCPRCGMFPRP